MNVQSRYGTAFRRLNNDAFRLKCLINVFWSSKKYQVGIGEWNMIVDLIDKDLLFLNCLEIQLQISRKINHYYRSGLLNRNIKKTTTISAICRIVHLTICILQAYKLTPS